MEVLITLAVICGIAIFGYLGYLLHSYSVETYKCGVFRGGAIAAAIFIELLAYITLGFQNDSGGLTLNGWVILILAVLGSLGLLVFNISKTNAAVGIGATFYQLTTSLVVVFIIILLSVRKK